MNPIRFFIMTLVLGCLSFTAYAQWNGSLTIRVKGPEGVVLKGVKIELKRLSIVCNPDSVKPESVYFKELYRDIYKVEAKAETFETVYDTVRVVPDCHVVKTLHLWQREFLLPVVSVKGVAQAVVYKGDTIQFNPAAVNKLQGDMAREILAQMPGVDLSNGNIKVHGHEVKRTYVDGQKTFGDNPNTALDHVTADNVLHIKAYEDPEDDKPKSKRNWALNIITRNKMVNSMDAKAIAAGGKTLDEGSQARHGNRYALGGVLNFFSKDLIYSVNLMRNNENVSSTSDLRFLQIDQVNPTYSVNDCIGFDINRSWNKRTKGLRNIAVGYQYTGKKTEQDTDMQTDYLPYGNIDWRTYDEQNRQGTDNRKHTVRLSSEFGLGNKATLSASLNQTFDETENNRLRFISDRSNLSSSVSSVLNRRGEHGNSTSGTLSLTQSLKKLNYTLTASGSRGVNSFSEERLDSISLDGTEFRVNEKLDMPGYNHNYNFTLGGKVFAKMKNPMQRLGISYNFDKKRENLSQRSWNLLTNDVDSVNTYHYINNRQTHDALLTFDTPLGKYYLATDVGIKHERIADDNREDGVEEVFHFNIPNILTCFSYTKPGTMMMLSLNYSMTGNAPDIMQLRRQLNNENPYFLTIGNPSLKAQTTHTVYTISNIPIGKYGGMIQLNVSAAFIRNSIVGKTTYYTADTYLPELDYTTLANSSVSSFLNVNGGAYFDATLRFDYPLSAIRSRMFVNLSGNYRRSPFYYDNQLDKAYTSNMSGSLNFSTSIIPKTRFSVDNRFHTMSSSNKVNDMSSRINTYSLSVKGEADLFRNFFVKAVYNYTHQHNNTLGNTQCQSILNIYAGMKCFDKRGEISITAYDLLNAYNGRMVYMQENYTRVTSQVNYGRFISLNFTWTFRKYKSMNSKINRGVYW